MLPARLNSSNSFRAAFPALLVAAFCLLNYHLLFLPAQAAADYFRFPGGSFLLAGLPGGGVDWNMPLYPAVLAAARNLGAGPAAFFTVCHLAAYALVFCAGRLLGGYRGGVLALAGAGLAEAAAGFAYDAEQSFYAVFLLLALSLLLLKRREETYGNNLLAGLAVGASLLVRTPLFIFPPLLAALGLFYGGARRGALIRRALVFLAASYILLLPWGRLNSYVSGRFSLFESGRASANLITAAKGAIFTMEGDSGRLAGLAGAGGALSYYTGELARAPGSFLLTALKRLWQIFLFSPLLFGAFLAAAALSREPDRLRLFCLPAYFFLIHSLLSIEARYFYPLLYLLPPLIAGSLLPARFAGEPDSRAPGGGLLAAIFSVCLCLVLFSEYLVLAYPSRAARSGAGREAFSAALERFPADRNLHELKCRQLWARGDDSGFPACLEVSRDRFGDGASAYFLAASASASPAALPLPAGLELDCLVIRLLRELELGDRAAAAVSLGRARGIYGASRNMLRGAPYEKDRVLAALIKLDPAGFFDGPVYRLLALWPPERMAGILSGLQALAPFGGRLKQLQGLAADARDHESGLSLRGWIATDIFGLPFGERGRLWKEGGRKAKALSDCAVELIRSGRLPGAEKLLLKAEAVGPGNPEVLMNLCALRARQGRQEAAAQACLRAAETVYLNPENRTPPLEILASEALLARYGLLAGLGRRAEAQEALRAAVKNAPQDWAGLAAARAELESFSDR